MFDALKTYLDETPDENYKTLTTAITQTLEAAQTPNFDTYEAFIAAKKLHYTYIAKDSKRPHLATITGTLMEYLNKKDLYTEMAALATGNIINTRLDSTNMHPMRQLAQATVNLNNAIENACIHHLSVTLEYPVDLAKVYLHLHPPPQLK